MATDDPTTLAELRRAFPDAGDLIDRLRGQSKVHLVAEVLRTRRHVVTANDTVRDTLLLVMRLRDQLHGADVAVEKLLRDAQVQPRKQFAKIMAGRFLSIRDHLVELMAAADSMLADAGEIAPAPATAGGGS